MEDVVISKFSGTLGGLPNAWITSLTALSSPLNFDNCFAQQFYVVRCQMPNPTAIFCSESSREIKIDIANVYKTNLVIAQTEPMLKKPEQNAWHLSLPVPVHSWHHHVRLSC